MSTGRHGRDIISDLQEEKINNLFAPNKEILLGSRLKDIEADLTDSLDAHTNGGASKHDATEIDFEYGDGSKLVVQAASDNVELAIRDLDASLGAHLNGGANKHDATEVDYERADGSKKNIAAGSDTVEAALTNLDDATGALSSLTTTANTSAVAAINELVTTKAPLLYGAADSNGVPTQAEMVAALGAGADGRVGIFLDNHGGALQPYVCGFSTAGGGWWYLAMTAVGA